MRKLLFSSLYIALSLILILTLRSFLPKYAGMLLALLVWLIFEGYLWFSVQETLKKCTGWVRQVKTCLYWMHLILLTGMVITGIFIPFLSWNIPLRTYMQSIILILFLTHFFPVLTLLLADFIRVIKYGMQLFQGIRTPFISIPRFRTLLISGWTAGAAVFTLLMCGILFWQFDFRIKNQSITLEELPPSFDGLKIVQFSDVHLGSWGMRSRLREAVEEINQLRPDIILFTGDMFNYSTRDGEGFDTILSRLRAPLGIYAILGNHDYGDYILWRSEEAKRVNMEDLKRWYRKLGWNLLRNSHAVLRRDSDSIAIIGVENWGATHRFQRLADVAEAQKGIENMKIQLLLSHDPTHWDSIVRKQFPAIDITFAGHTHGGQAGIDCFGIHWSPVAWTSKCWGGLYESTNHGTLQYLYVNVGLGNIGYAGRIGILPEITLIILRQK